MNLEALVAHIYVVGGRTIGSPPPGMLAMPAPKRITRARHEETFFNLLVPNGSVKAQAQVYQEFSEQLAEAYFKTTGGITGGLRDALTELNQNILTQQKAIMQPLRAALVCAVMREQELYVARCGPMMAVFRSGENITPFPMDRGSESMSLSPPLGATMEPRIELNRFDLEVGCMLLLADHAFADASDEALKSAMLAADDIGGVLEPLRAMVRAPMAHATIIQFVTEDTPTPELPSLPARPKLAPAPKAPEPEPAPVPETPVDTPAEIAPPEAKTPDVKRSSQVMKVVARTLSSVGDTTTKLSNRIFSEEDIEESAAGDAEAPPDRRSGYPLLSNLVVLIALLIPFVMVVVVVGLVLSQPGSSPFEVCRQEVLARTDAARQLTPAQGIVLNDENTVRAREQWELVMQEALDCERNKPGDEEMLRVAGEAQNNLDRFDKVERREILQLRRFQPNADLRGPISGNWITIYTLDRNADEIYQDALAPDGATLVAVSDDPIIFRGQNIGGEVVGELVDIEWLERGGLPSGNSNVPIALDDSGLLIWYSETFGENETLRLVLPDTWVQPVAMAVWRLNLYVLDSTGQQLWRYVPNEGIYSEIPTEYFAGEDRPDLSAAVDFGIDEDGNVYILFSNGNVKKYFGGVEQPFDVYNLPEGALTAGASLFVDNNPISRGLVVTDPQNATVYAMSMGGTINTGYRPLTPLDAFTGLSGTLVNADTNSVYVLAGNSLYHMRRR